MLSIVSLFGGRFPLEQLRAGLGVTPILSFKDASKTPHGESPAGSEARLDWVCEEGSQSPSPQPTIWMAAEPPKLCQTESFPIQEQLRSAGLTVGTVGFSQEEHEGDSEQNILKPSDWLSWLKTRPMPEKDWILAESATVSHWLHSLERAQAYNDQVGQLNAELYARNQQVEKELYTARQLQQSLLPPFLEDDPHRPAPTSRSEHEVTSSEIDILMPEVPAFSKCHYNSDSLRVTGVYLPCDALGGDIYDVINFPDGSMDVSVADVSGHGVPAGFITAIYKSTCYRATHLYHQPGDILHAVNQELCQLVKTGHYVTSVYCKLRPIENTPQVLLHYSGAGHPYPVLFQATTQKICRLEENGLPLAWMPDGEYHTRSMMLSPGDKLLLFTDGITELKNLSDELYGEPRLEALFESLCQQTHSQAPLLDVLINALSQFADGALLPDDISVLLVEMI